jgi:hypothetical protein
VYKLLKVSLCCLLLGGCTHQVTREPSTAHRATTYRATYSFSLSVKRPEEASQRYGPQEVETVSSNEEDYRYYFEDGMARVLWAFRGTQMAFSLENKTEHSIKIPWDQAAFIDESGRGHRVMHAGVKFDDREKPQAPSVVVPKGLLKDIVAPTDYVHWREGTRHAADGWEEKCLLPDFDVHGSSLKGGYATFADFESAAKAKVGKTIQVLLPLEIGDVVNDYIFAFRIDSANAFEEAGQSVEGGF